MPKQEQDEIPRRRGRPSGKNRVPLSAEERRARNAQYERERRNEYAEAMIDLANAAGCESSISNPDLLATVLSKIQRAAKRNSTDSIDELKRLNDNLESQIASLTERLGNDPEPNEMPAAKKYKQSETSELRTDSEPQTSNCFYDPADRAAKAAKKRINKLKKGKVRKVRKQAAAARHQPHSSTESLTWSEDISSASSNERSERESPVILTPPADAWTNVSPDFVLTTDNEQEQNSNTPVNGVITESYSSDGNFQYTFDIQAEYPEMLTLDQYDQISDLEPLVQRTQYNPPPDLVSEVPPPPDNNLQSDRLNAADNHLPLDSENISDLFTESEKRLITEWINGSADVFATEAFDNNVPARQWSVDDYLTS